MQLTDGVVRLRRFRSADAPAIAVACDDPETARFIPGMPSPYTEADARLFLERCERAWHNRERPLAIVDHASDGLLGAIEVQLGEPGSVGYWVAPEARGRGIATRALILLSRWATREGGVERLQLTTHPDNAASQRVAEKAGFERDGVVRADADFPDGRTESILYSLPRDTSGGA